MVKHLTSIFLCLMLLTANVTWAKEFDITLFGTNLLNKQSIQTKYEKDLVQLKINYDKDVDLYKTEKITLESKLKNEAPFTYVNVHLFKSYAGKYDFIIDFVEENDTEKRLNFKALLKKELEDPEGLLKTWSEYRELSSDLFNKGEINDYSCPVIHCLWAFNHERLQPFLNRLNARVPSNKGALIEILNHSKDSKHRASAAFLLAHAKLSNEELLDTLLPSIKDPSSNVRNASLRVIYYISRAHPALITNLSPVLDVIDFPSFTDRNKALVILRSVTLDELSKVERNRLIPILLEIMEKKDAHNYRNAHLVLKKLSGQTFNMDDIQSWRSWAQSQNISHLQTTPKTQALAIH